MKPSSKYLAKLAVIRNYLIAIRNGAWQEETEVVTHRTSRGTCFYDQCPDKKRRCDRLIAVYRDGKTASFSGSFIHSSCIEGLLKDERLPCLN
ncbi:hypothetical protein J4462_02975 [Candidatus Pacearchaeota archaeon]|nr:hypothetical protein [Candidatus Pacearchaeota archaeon]